MVRALFRWAWRLLIALVVFCNVRLYAPTPLAATDNTLPPSLLAQLAANREAIDSGAPEQMQTLFPEGFFFCHVLHGLTWIEAALRDPTLQSDAIKEARAARAQLDSQQGREPFDKNLPPDHGMFYAAWTCHLQAGIALLATADQPAELLTLRDQCDTIAQAIRESPTPFLASYPDSVWPCDTLPAIHALVVFDRITKQDRYSAIVQQWLSAAKARLDPESGLIPHMAVTHSGQPSTVARATSQVIILRLLADIDPPFASEQYETFRQRFLTTFLGVPCLREYPSGISGSGDIDSGPLIFGRSLSATVLMMGVAQLYGDQQHADAIARCGETVGMPWTSKDRKRYVGGILPVGAIIVAYAHVARRWLAGDQHFPTQQFETYPLVALADTLAVANVPCHHRALRKKTTIATKFNYRRGAGPMTRCWLAVLVTLTLYSQLSAKQFSVTDFGATANDQTDDTAAIERTLQATAEAGGGTVFIPRRHISPLAPGQRIAHPRSPTQHDDPRRRTRFDIEVHRGGEPRKLLADDWRAR